MKIKHLISIAFMAATVVVAAPALPSLSLSTISARDLLRGSDAPGSVPGKCAVYGTLQQQCKGGKVVTTVTASVSDRHGEVMVDATSGKEIKFQDQQVAIEHHNGGEGVVIFEDGKQYAYATIAPGTANHYNLTTSAVLLCEADSWTGEVLTCDGSEESKRSRPLTCFFACPTTHINPRDTTVEQAFADQNQTPVTGTELIPSYAHGICAFHFILTQYCLLDMGGWHTETHADLPTIEDNDRKTVVRYPSGSIGRVDGTIKRLIGIGQEGLSMTYWSDNETYFRFDGGLWSTKTVDDGKAYGLCKMGKWVGAEFEVCGKNNAGKGKAIEGNCIFRC